MHKTNCLSDSFLSKRTFIHNVYIGIKNSQEKASVVFLLCRQDSSFSSQQCVSTSAGKKSNDHKVAAKATQTAMQGVN